MSCGGGLPPSPLPAITPTQTPQNPPTKAFGLPIRTWALGFGSFLGLIFVLITLAMIGSSARKPMNSSAPVAVPSLAPHASSEHDASMAQPLRVIPTPKAVEFQVTYEVIAEKGQHFSVTYTNAQGGTEQDNNTTATTKYLSMSDGTKVNKWLRKFKADPGASLHIQAQSQEEHAALIVRIYVDGDQIRDSKTTGAYAIASCDYDLPSLGD